MITARTIAEQLGVSVSTVGRAMADDPRISAATKARVQRAAERAGYAANMPARVMRGGTSNIVGLLIPEIRNDFYSAMAQALSEASDRAGFRLILSLTGDDREVEARHLRELAGARAAGIIIVPTSAPKRASARLLQEIPHVQLLRHVSALNNTWFGIDDSEVMISAVNHLTRLGHRKIVYAGASEKLSTGAARVEGFRRGIMSAGLPPSAGIEMLGRPSHQRGVDAVQELMEKRTGTTAIVSGSVNVTLGIVQEIERTGVQVPKNLSIIGFGDPEWASWWRGGMTTIRPPIEELVTSCGLWFFDKLRSRSQDKPLIERRQSLIASSLVQRHTTAQVTEAD